MQTKWLVTLVGLALVASVTWLIVDSQGHSANGVELLNVSYDPTRELWRDLNAAFEACYLEDTGMAVAVKQSHGASASQALSLIHI